MRSHDLHVNSDGSVTIVGTFEGTLSSGTTCYCLDFGLHNISSQFQSGFISNYNPNSGWTSAHHIGGKEVDGYTGSGQVHPLGVSAGILDGTFSGRLPSLDV